MASPAFAHYAVIWGRDALISSLGALSTDDGDLHRTVADTLDTLVGGRSELGQLPALVDPARGVWDWSEGGAVDVSAWFVVVAAAWLDRTGDLDRARSWWVPCVDAIQWLRHQDVTGTGLVSAAPATDWMDAAFTRSGRTLLLNVLWAWALDSFERLGSALGEGVEPRAADARTAVDSWFWPDPDVDPVSLFPHGFSHTTTQEAWKRVARTDRDGYLSHIVHAGFIDRRDTLGNVLAIRTGIAGGKADRVLDGVAPALDPHPSRTYERPVGPGDDGGMYLGAVDDVIDPRWTNAPGTYHNGAVWPFVGGFHVEAIASTRGADAAAPSLESLAAANALGDWSFPEWITLDGQPDGAPQQTWSAGTYLLAHRAVTGG